MDEAGESCSANCAVRNIQRYTISYKQCRNVNAASALIRLLLKQLNARDYWHCLLMNQIIYINYIVFYGVWYYINNALWCTVHVSWELSWQMFASTADWDFSVNLGEVGVCSSSQSDIHVQGCFKGNCFTTQDTGQLLIVFMLFFFFIPFNINQWEKVHTPQTILENTFLFILFGPLCDLACVFIKFQ